MWPSFNPITAASRRGQRSLFGALRRCRHRCRCRTLRICSLDRGLGDRGTWRTSGLGRLIRVAADQCRGQTQTGDQRPRLESERFRHCDAPSRVSDEAGNHGHRKTGETPPIRTSPKTVRGMTCHTCTASIVVVSSGCINAQPEFHGIGGDLGWPVPAPGPLRNTATPALKLPSASGENRRSTNLLPFDPQLTRHQTVLDKIGKNAQVLAHLRPKSIRETSSCGAGGSEPLVVHPGADGLGRGYA